MINRTRRKFILSTMAVMALLLLLLLGALNLTMYFSTEHQVYRAMEQLARADGVPFREGPGRPKEKSPSSPPRGDNLPAGQPLTGFLPPARSDFSVKLSFDGTVLGTYPAAPYELTSSEVDALITSAVATGVKSGSLGRFRFLLSDRPYGQILVFHDTQLERSTQLRLLLVTGGIFLLSLVAVFPLSLVLSRWAVRPVKDAFEKQRQFIADASHELRTPITVIRAGAELLETELGENRWLSPILSESRRMQEQISDLLFLAKSDHPDRPLEKREFDLSKVVRSAALSFECLAYEHHQTLTTQIEENLTLCGDEAQIGQLCAILLDNAVKHTPKGGEITLSLSAHGRARLLTLRNTGAGISAAEQERVFERFYRTSSARAGTSGSGLGLSIAKTIVDAHGGKIAVSSHTSEYTEFTVTL